MSIYIHSCIIYDSVSLLEGSWSWRCFEFWSPTTCIYRCRYKPRLL